MFMQDYNKQDSQDNDTGTQDEPKKNAYPQLHQAIWDTCKAIRHTARDG